jgi:hypothetical protein
LAKVKLRAGELLTEVAKNHRGHFDKVCEIADLAKTRVYDLMKAAKGGLKALEAMQEGNRKRQQKYRARKKGLPKPAKAAAKAKAEPKPDSVTPPNVTETPPMQPAGNGRDPEAAEESRNAAMEQVQSAEAPATAEPTADHVELRNWVDEFKAACDLFLPRVAPCERMSCLEYAWELIERLAAAQDTAHAA